MSEAMTNPEIEDVLASIRRLVAQDRRPRPERLILTEEYRVRQANIAAPPVPPAAPADAAPQAALPLVQIVAEAVRAAPEAPPAAADPEPVAPAAADAAPEPPGTTAPDLAALEATVRDLEAAIPGGGATPGSAPPTGPRAEIVGDDVAFIDEADLERMVARIVREELRGQLGERITLQVRKLVRAEIARALDERNLLG
jgi:hypothetical protein